MGLAALDCPKCGARLKASIGVMTCEYCGTQVSPQKAQPATKVTVTTAPSAGAQTSAPTVRPGRYILFSLLMTLGIGGFTAYTALSTAGGVQAVVPALEQAFSQGGVPSIPGMPSRSDGAIEGLPAGSSAMWDDVGGLPRLATIQGKEAVIGRLRVRPDDHLYFAAFAADTGALLYRVGPLGTYSEGYRAAHAAVAGDRLAVSDPEARLRLVDLETGEEKQVLPFSDRIERLCTADDRLFARLVDDREFAVDTQSGELSEAKIPGDCSDTATRTLGIPTPDDRKALRKAPKVKGFTASNLHVDGEQLVVGGYRDPGTAVPMAIGVDPKSKDVRWKIDVPSIDPLRARERSNQFGDLAGGRYVTVYGEGDKAWHLTAFDADTGARLWDTPLRVIFAVDHLGGVVASDTRVYVVRMSSLEIYDAASGALQQTIGAETYE